MPDGFIRVAAASVAVTVADAVDNAQKIRARIDQAQAKQVNLLVLPELCVTGYTCGDLFYSDLLLRAAEEQVLALRDYTKGKDPVVVVGFPLRLQGKLYNCAELLPASASGEMTQKTEDLVGPYELHDFFLYYMLRYGACPRKLFRLARLAFAGLYDDATILHWLEVFTRRFFAQQFKRSCLPDGVKVGTVTLSPRGDWRMPSDASGRMWLDEIAALKQ